MQNTNNVTPRQPLPEGFNLILTEPHADNSYSLIIHTLIGTGGSCLVYKGLKSINTDAGEIKAQVIIKELYPVGLSILREDNYSLNIPDKSRRSFEGYRESFEGAVSEHYSYYEYYKDKALPRIFIYGEANGTAYAVSDPGQGRLLSGTDVKDLKLEQIAAIMESVCKAIKGIHIHEKLYLDCKPDNFFYYADKNALEANVYLFDFDTVESLKDIRLGKNKSCPYTKGWAAPEQIPSEFDGRYSDPYAVGYHTDIFSIGALFFWLLTGHEPSDGDLKKIKNNTFLWEKEAPALACADTYAQNTAKELLQKMLEPDVNVRKQSFKNYLATKALEEDFAKLYGLCAGDNIHFAPIHGKLEELSRKNDEINENVKRSSIGHFFFGSKKRTTISVVTFAAAAALAGFLGFLGANAARKLSGEEVYATQDAKLLDTHIIFESDSSDHNYKTGLENWRRLDYNRAYRDISAAIHEVDKSENQESAYFAALENSFGCLCLDMGRYEEAYDYLNSANVTFTGDYGADSEQALASKFSVAQYDYYTGDADSSLKTLQRIIDSTDTLESKALAAAVGRFQARIYNERGEYDEAISSYERIFKMYDDILKDGRLTEEFSGLLKDSRLSQTEADEYTGALENILTTYAEAGESYVANGQAAEAESLLENAIETALENVYIGRKNLVTSKLYVSLAKCMEAQGNLKKAIESIDLAERIQKYLFDYEGTYPGLAEIYYIYGDLLLKDKEADKAYNYFTQALELAGSAYGENHPVTAECSYRLGGWYLSENRLAESLPYLQRAVEIRKNILGFEHESTLRYLQALSEAKALSGETEEADKIKQEAEELSERLGIRL